MHLVLDSPLDLASAWPLLTATLRRTIVEGWIEANKDFAQLWSHIDLDTWGYASRPRPLGPNRELVLLVDTAATGPRIERMMLVPGLAFEMELGDARNARKRGAVIPSAC